MRFHYNRDPSDQCSALAAASRLLLPLRLNRRSPSALRHAADKCGDYGRFPPVGGREHRRSSMPPEPSEAHVEANTVVSENCCCVAVDSSRLRTHPRLLGCIREPALMSPYSRPGTETRATAQPESIKGGKYKQNIARHDRGVWLADRTPCTDGITCESGAVS